MADKMTILHDEDGNPAFAVLPWTEYRRLVAAQVEAAPRSRGSEAAAFKRALASRPVGGDAVDLGLAEAGARFKAQEARARGRAARRSGTVVDFVPMEVVAAILAGVAPLKAWREHARMTQQQLADKAGLSRAYLAQLEGGTRAGAVDVLAKLAAVIGCLVDDLIDTDPDVGAGAGQ